MENNDRFSAPKSAIESTSPIAGVKHRRPLRTGLEIIVPTPAEKIGLLADRVGVIEALTAFDHKLCISVDGEVPEALIGDVTSMLSSLRREDWKLMQSSHGLNQAIDRDLGNSTEAYVAVIPVDRLLNDVEWFGKMQAPFLRDSTCGMTFAFDSMAGNTRPPHRWDRKYDVPGHVFMVPRFAIEPARRSIKFAVADDDYANHLQHALHGLGLSTWAVPSVRLM